LDWGHVYGKRLFILVHIYRDETHDRVASLARPDEGPRVPVKRNSGYVGYGEILLCDYTSRYRDATHDRVASLARPDGGPRDPVDKDNEQTQYTMVEVCGDWPPYLRYELW